MVAVTRQDRKRITREKIVATSLELFAQQGIAATSTAAIAEAAGIAHGTIFLHFPTREDLVAEAISRVAKQVIDGIHALVEGGATVRDVFDAHLRGLAAHEAFYARLVTEGPALPPHARHTLLGIQSVISLLLSEAAEPEVRAGRMRRMPIHMLFNTWIGLVHHYVANRDLFAPRESVLLARREELISHFMGLLAP